MPMRLISGPLLRRPLDDRHAQPVHKALAELAVASRSHLIVEDDLHPPHGLDAPDVGHALLLDLLLREDVVDAVPIPDECEQTEKDLLGGADVLVDSEVSEPVELVRLRVGMQYLGATGSDGQVSPVVPLVLLV